MMLNRIRLWWLELRLESHLGKHDAYLNRIHETNQITLDEKIKVAKAVLAWPPLSKGRRWAEHQRLARRHHA